MISPAQCRAARALLSLTQDDLAKAAKVSVTTLRGFEIGRGSPRMGFLKSVQTTLETSGVTFDMLTGAGPGVRFAEAEAPDSCRDHAKPIGPATDVIKRMDAEIAADRKKRERP